MESFLDNNMFAAKTRLDRASFDIFTYHGEDGIIGYLLRNLGNIKKKFIDINIIYKNINFYSIFS